MKRAIHALLVLDDGSLALGPEFEAGIQTFPLRPLAFEGTFRIAGLSGAGNATTLAGPTLGARIWF